MNDFTRLTPEQGFRVCAWMRTLFDLKGTELELFAIVCSYTQNGGEVGGNRFFMEWTGASEDTVTRSLKNLEQAGLIAANGAGRGKLKKYTISDRVNKKLAEVGIIENYPQNAGALKDDYPQNAGSQESLLPAKCGYHPPQNAGTTTRKMRVHHPQNAGSNQIIKKIENKQERKKDNNYRITQPPSVEEPPLVQAAMQPLDAPEFHEVYGAMRNLLVRPIGTELEKCAHAFYDLRETQGWSHDWKAHLIRYAAAWAARARNVPPQRPERDKPRPCQPDDPVQDFGEIPW